MANANRRAEEFGAHQTELKKKFVQAFVDTERTLRLDAAGYETAVIPFVPPTVTRITSCFARVA